MQNLEAGYSDWGFHVLPRSLLENVCHNSFLPYPSKSIISKVYNVCSWGIVVVVRKKVTGFGVWSSLKVVATLCISLSAGRFCSSGVAVDGRHLSRPTTSRSCDLSALLTRLRGVNTQQPQEVMWLYARTHSHSSLSAFCLLHEWSWGGMRSEF